MTRLMTSGWETGDPNESGTTIVDVLGVMTLSAVSSTPTPRAGNYCLKGLATTNTANNNFGLYKQFILPSAAADMWVRFAIYLHFSTGGGEVTLITFLDPTSQATACVTYNVGDSLLRARQSLYYAGALLGVSAVSMAQDTWHLIEVRQQITSTTAGITEVWLDGNRVINFSGDNTSSSGLTTQYVCVGSVYTSNAIGTGGYWAIDDLAINDTSGSLNNARPGDGRVVLLTPSGAGVNAPVLLRGGTDSGANWSQVDEVPPSLLDFVYSNTPGDRETYAMTDLPANAGVRVVEELIFGRNSDVGAGSIGPTIKSGSTTNELTAISMGTSVGYIGGRWETDPATGIAWSSAAVNAVEAGVTIH